MNKKVIKFFIFSLILVCCFFGINKCSAMTTDELYDTYEYYKNNNYYGDNLEPVSSKTVCFDSFTCILDNYSRSDFDTYIRTTSYFYYFS